MKQNELYKKLAEIQATLKAPKNQYNSYSKFNYRSCEDILEAVKPLLDGAVLTISDEIIAVGDRVYVKATVRLTDGESFITNEAFAREPLAKKGMDDSQITGSTSSYARKYALNGLFCIDDTKDADSMDNTTSKKGVDIKAVAKECGWTMEQVLNSYNPPLTNINQITDLKSCADYLRANKVK